MHRSREFIQRQATNQGDLWASVSLPRLLVFVTVALDQCLSPLHVVPGRHRLHSSSSMRPRQRSSTPGARECLRVEGSSWRYWARAFTRSSSGTAGGTWVSALALDPAAARFESCAVLAHDVALLGRDCFWQRLPRAGDTPCCDLRSSLNFSTRAARYCNDRREAAPSA